MKDVIGDFYKAFVFSMCGLFAYDVINHFFIQSKNIDMVTGVGLAFVVASIYVFKNLINDVRI